QGRRLGIGLILASIPIILIGLTLGQTVKQFLFNDIAIAIGLIVGGLIIIWIEKHPPQVRAHEVEDLSIKDAIWIGLIQVLSLISCFFLSGATIIGAMFLGVSCNVSNHFSFFLDMTVVVGAGLLDIFQCYVVLCNRDDFSMLAPGLLIHLISALLIINAPIA